MIGVRDNEAQALPPPSRAPELAALIFPEGGLLQANLDLEHRPGQERMASAVAAAFRDDGPLLVEAGTGIGKSLAYLVPGIIHATDCGRQLIVSTHTISLQEQIERKDLPLCRRLFASAPELAKYAGFVATVLVGKSNYLCTSRLSHALAERASLFDDAGYAELQRVADWAETTETGLRHELQPPPSPDVWESVNADSSSCSRRNCDCGRCFYQRARARVRSAQVIVVNHSLLFSLINVGGARAEGAGAQAAGVLFPGDFVVLDEAHTVPEVAEESFGLSLSSLGVERALKHLYNPKTRRGIMKKRGDSELRQRVSDVLDASGQFFGFLAGTLLAERPVVRVREAGVAEPLLSEPLAALERSVAKIADALEDGRERDELLEQRARLRGIRGGVDEWLGLANQGHVYWAEKGGRRQTIVTLRSAPVDVAPELERCLFGAGVGVVCTSATLALAGEMGPFAAAIGAAHARSAGQRVPVRLRAEHARLRGGRHPSALGAGFPVGDRRACGLCRLLLRAGGRGLARPLHELPGHAGRRRSRRAPGGLAGAPVPHAGRRPLQDGAGPEDARRGKRGALRNRQLLDGGGRPGGRALAGCDREAALQPAHPPDRRGEGGAHQGPGRRPLQRTDASRGGHKVPPGRGPPHPDADRPRRHHRPGQPRPGKVVRTALHRGASAALVHRLTLGNRAEQFRPFT